jgi:hypothetical protein
MFFSSQYPWLYLIEYKLELAEKTPTESLPDGSWGDSSPSAMLAAHYINIKLCHTPSLQLMMDFT